MGTIATWTAYVFGVKFNAQFYLTRTPLTSTSEFFGTLMKEIRLENVDTYQLFIPMYLLLQFVILGAV